MTRLTPAGHARDLAVTTPRPVIEAVAGANTAPAAATLHQAEPRSPGNTAPTTTAAACTGVAPGLPDDWLTGGSRHTPPGPGQHARLPTGHRTGQRAATGILALARKGRASASPGTLTARQGTMHAPYRSAHSLAATTQARAAQPARRISDPARTAIP